MIEKIKNWRKIGEIPFERQLCDLTAAHCTVQLLLQFEGRSGMKEMHEIKKRGDDHFWPPTLQPFRKHTDIYNKGCFCSGVGVF